MGFSKKLIYYLVHSAGFTNAAAKKMLLQGEVAVDGITVYENCALPERAEVSLRGQILRPARKHVYLKFYKPKGYQSSLNANVPDNLSAFFGGYNRLAIAGRLDKDSEGLLLLSSDGKWVEKICNPDSEKEKEYRVSLDRRPDPSFVERFASGVLIGNYQTRPCVCEWLGAHEIRVVLTEGKNRQIRRMVHQLGYQVERLVRTRIDQFNLADLKPGDLKHVEI